MKRIFNLLLALTVTVSAFAVEAKQNRGLFAFVNGNAVQVSWRMRATDDPIKTCYELYIDGNLFGKFRNKTNTRVNLAKYRNSTFKVVVKDAAGNIIDEQDGVKAKADAYVDIPLTAPVIRNSAGETVITYSPMDCSAYDMDGDGEQEIIVKWEPSDLYNTTQKIPGNEFFDCYKLNGTRLWRIDMGQNSVAGNNIPFMCWDFDGDGKGELIVKSAPGTKDATGKYVGEGLPGYPADLQTVYYRGSDKIPTRGEEWITCFDGVTGKELASRKYWPYFGIHSNWNPGGSTDGEGYGRRGNGLKGAVLKIPCRDGVVRPVCVMQRGAYTYSYALAISWNGKELVEEWRHSSASSSSSTTVNATGTHTQSKSIYGEGAHSSCAADLDGDGYDELDVGAAALDHDGTVLWDTNLGHGDAVHVGEFNPNNPGIEAWRITEGKTKYDACMIDGTTGKILNGQLVTGGDVSRGVVMDVDSTHAGKEYFHMNSGYIFDCDGNAILPKNMGKNNGYPNYRIYWDHDLLDEHCSGAMITKYDLASQGLVRCVKARGNNSSLWSYYGISTINSTKQNPCLQCDLFGDWREELVMYATASVAGRSDCNFVLRIITTTYETDRKLPWLRDDNTYNMQIACQNVGYSQPPHLGYDPFAYYASLGKMESNEIFGELPGGDDSGGGSGGNEGGGSGGDVTGDDEPLPENLFTPDPAKYYYIKVNDGIWIRFATFTNGFAQASTTENLIQFIPSAQEGAYYLKSSDNYYLRDNGNYGFGGQTELSGATSYIGMVHDDGKVSFKSTKTYANGNNYIGYDAGRGGIGRGSSADAATHFIVEETDVTVNGIIERLITPSQSVIYSISGIKRNTLRPGVNIIHANGGKVVKVTGNK